MELDPTILGLALVIFAGYAVQTITGFGSMLLAVTFGALFMDVREIVTLAVPISMLQTGYITIRHRDEVRWRLLLLRILPVMGVGVVIGLFVIAGLAEGPGLKRAFGVMVLLLAARELWRMRPRATAETAPLHPVASLVATFAAGIVHGIYATGGPLLVYAIGRTQLSKGEIRSTLSVVWLVFNFVLLGTFATEGRYDASAAVTVGLLVPAVGLGILVGEILHHRVDERRFRGAMFALVLLASIALITR